VEKMLLKEGQMMLRRRKTKNSKIRKERRINHDRRRGLERRSTDIVYALPKDAVLNTQQACHYLHVSRPTYMKYIAQGKINAQKIGRGWKVYKSELDRFARAI